MTHLSTRSVTISTGRLSRGLWTLQAAVKLGFTVAACASSLRLSSMERDCVEASEIYTQIDLEYDIVLALGALGRWHASLKVAAQ